MESKKLIEERNAQENIYKKSYNKIIELNHKIQTELLKETEQKAFDALNLFSQQMMENINNNEEFNQEQKEFYLKKFNDDQLVLSSIVDQLLRSDTTYLLDIYIPKVAKKKDIVEDWSNSKLTFLKFNPTGKSMKFIDYLDTVQIIELKLNDNQISTNYMPHGMLNALVEFYYPNSGINIEKINNIKLGSLIKTNKLVLALEDYEILHNHINIGDQIIIPLDSKDNFKHDIKEENGAITHIQELDTFEHEFKVLKYWMEVDLFKKYYHYNKKQNIDKENSGIEILNYKLVNDNGKNIIQEQGKFELRYFIIEKMFELFSAVESEFKIDKIKSDLIEYQKELDKKEGEIKNGNDNN